MQICHIQIKPSQLIHFPDQLSPPSDPLISLQLSHPNGLTPHQLLLSQLLAISFPSTSIIKSGDRFDPRILMIGGSATPTQLDQLPFFSQPATYFRRRRGVTHISRQYVSVQPKVPFPLWRCPVA